MKKILLLVFSILIFTSCNNKSDDGLLSQNDTNKIIEEIKYIAKEKLNPENLGENIDISLPPRLKTDNREELLNNIKKSISKDKRAEWIYENFDHLSQIEQYLVGNDDDTIEFVYNNNNNINNFEYKEGETKKYGRSTPYYLQWDNRWAYNKLADSNIGIAGCGPTSIAMILARLDNNQEITPKVIAEDAEDYMVEEGISWSFFDDEIKKYGHNIQTINLSENEMIEALKKGPLLVSVSRGYFTLNGHIIVIDSYDNGNFIVNDPNSYKNSQRPWTYEQIQDQIVKIWSIY